MLFHEAQHSSEYLDVGFYTSKILRKTVMSEMSAFSAPPHLV